jgi:hypothetical protein
MDERERYVEMCSGFEKNKLEGLKITLKEASFIKIFCDAYFLAKIQPKALDALQARIASERDGPESPSAPPDLTT